MESKIQNQYTVRQDYLGEGGIYAHTTLVISVTWSRVLLYYSIFMLLLSLILRLYCVNPFTQLPCFFNGFNCMFLWVVLAGTFTCSPKI